MWLNFARQEAAVYSAMDAALQLAGDEVARRLKDLRRAVTALSNRLFAMVLNDAQSVDGFISFLRDGPESDLTEAREAFAECTRLELMRT